MAELLESLYRANLSIEEQFKYRAILAILPESFELPIVTILEGLQELGFTIYVIGKSNINSWFANTVIDDPRKVDFDFILSAFHWGTRWDYFEKFRLHSHFKVLIDACDNRGAGYWEAKYQEYRKRFQAPLPPTNIMMEELQPYRWIMPLGDYKPDLVFASQKVPSDQETHYLPFGIRRGFLELYEGREGKEREIDFAAIPGYGPKRRKLEIFFNEGKLPGHTFNMPIWGRKIVPKGIASLAGINNFGNDASYGAWVLWEDYFKVLNSTKCLVYPGISEKTAWWDSKRPWEAYASGCLVLLEKPSVDMAGYPVMELCPEVIYDSLSGLTEMCNRLYSDLERLEVLRKTTCLLARRYFTSLPLARYFLAITRKAI